MIKCTCIEDTEAQMREKIDAGGLNDLIPKGGTLKSMRAKNMAFMFSSGDFSLNIPFEAEFTFANGKTKTKDIRMIASHCPFCGKAFK